ncbi:MAG: response regulator with CheY-like receiver domain and winged-helix DNA-binding domain [Acidimicrobiales bacterium]|jgi:DNA-binding response OmpR family regulator|nr:response regulator with CheY-like receiver domain and winged-helix DNA-binding domain [Acidimicrobiales bacterium]
MAKVLLVDDEPDILLMLRMAFEDEGHEIVMAADGRMALERLVEHLPDVVLLDMMMPVVDGWGVLDAMKVEGNETPVVVVSAKSDPKDCKRALELGAIEYVLKPFDLDRLLTLVTAVAGEDADAREARRRGAIAAQGD